MGVDIDVRELVANLSVPAQQMVAMARAISTNAKVMVIDEATSSLDENEVQIFFNVLRRLKSQGMAIIFVSHRLNEIYEICDYMTILKDGEVMGESEVAKTSRLELISKMIGRDANTILKNKKEYNPKIEKAKPVVQVRGITTKTKLRNIDLDIREGEVVGLAGLLGSGRTGACQDYFWCRF